MQLFVRDSADRTVTLDVLASASITSVLSKTVIRFKGWAGQHRHALFLGGTPLEPGRSLSDYSVFNHATLQLLSLQRGGMLSDSESSKFDDSDFDESDLEVMDVNPVGLKSTQPWLSTRVLCRSFP